MRQRSHTAESPTARIKCSTPLAVARASRYVGSRPLLVLLHSLLAIGFDRFEDTVFVRGGGGRDRPPRWSTLDAISGAFIDKRRAVLIDVAESNLDWHGARDNRPSSKPN